MANHSLSAGGFDKTLGLGGKPDTGREERLVALLNDNLSGHNTLYGVVWPPIASASALIVAQSVDGRLVKENPFLEVAIDQPTDADALVDSFNNSSAGQTYSFLRDKRTFSGMTVSEYSRMIQEQPYSTLPIKQS